MIRTKRPHFVLRNIYLSEGMGNICRHKICRPQKLRRNRSGKSEFEIFSMRLDDEQFIRRIKRHNIGGDFERKGTNFAFRSIFRRKSLVKNNLVERFDMRAFKK